ncbi:MAG: hypothetical protein K8S98_08315 [Planctomycetes bacterium]|nr:hypothetical protein [Planctomycetota bacterium]
MPPSSDAPSPPRARRGAWRKFAIACASLVLALIAAELGLRAVQYVRGRPYVARKVENRLSALRAALSDGVPRERAEAKARKPNAPEPRVSHDVLHPYVGFEQSNHNDRLEAEITYFRNDTSKNVFDVFVFGGSVAGGFESVSSGAFHDLLAADPRFANRPVHVWVEGRAAHKEPQQVALLDYLLCCGVEPDAVIALDGFNEVAIGMQNVRAEITHLYPYLSAWLARAGGMERNEEAFELALDLYARRGAALGRIERLLDLGAARFAMTGELGLAWVERSAHEVTDRMLRLQTTLTASNRVDELAPPNLPGDDDVQVDRCVRNWYEGARSLAGVCRARNIAFLEVLQPTLHDTGSKPLTENEVSKGEAIEPWTTGVHLGYPKLRAAGKELARSGVAFLDASFAFEHETRSLYVDACHFELAGYEVLSRMIAPALLTEIERVEARRQ